MIIIDLASFVFIIITAASTAKEHLDVRMIINE